MTGSNSEYFLAELLDSDSETTKTLIAEVDGHVVGFMSFSCNVSHDRLNDNFDLKQFDYLRKGK